MSTVTTGFCSFCWTLVPLVPLMVELWILYLYHFGYWLILASLQKKTLKKNPYILYFQFTATSQSRLLRNVNYLKLHEIPCENRIPQTLFQLVKHSCLNKEMLRVCEFSACSAARISDIVTVMRLWFGCLLTFFFLTFGVALSFLSL